MAPFPKVFSVHLQKTPEAGAATIFANGPYRNSHCFITLTGSSGQERMEGWLAPAPHHLGFQVGVVRRLGWNCLGAGAEKPRMTQSLVSVGPVNWRPDVWPL